MRQQRTRKRSTVRPRIVPPDGTGTRTGRLGSSNCALKKNLYLLANRRHDYRLLLNVSLVVRMLGSRLLGQKSSRAG